jgi:hypothetical protein
MILIIEYNSSEWISFRCEDESSFPRSILWTNLVQIWRPWAGIRSGATVSPDVFKVLYLEKHIEILCYYVLTKLVNGSLYDNTKWSVVTLTGSVLSKNGRLVADDIIWQQDSFHYCNMLPCITGLHLQSPRRFLSTFTNFTVLVPHSRDCSYYESSRILPLPMLRLHEHTALRAHNFAHSSDLWHHPTLPNVTCAWSWRLNSKYFRILNQL